MKRIGTTRRALATLLAVWIACAQGDPTILKLYQPPKKSERRPPLPVLRENISSQPPPVQPPMPPPALPPAPLPAPAPPRPPPPTRPKIEQPIREQVAPPPVAPPPVEAPAPTKPAPSYKKSHTKPDDEPQNRILSGWKPTLPLWLQKMQPQPKPTTGPILQQQKQVSSKLTKQNTSLSPLLAKLLTNDNWVFPALTGAVLVTKACNSRTIRRAVYFWRRAGPIVAHYLFAQWWLGVRQADRAHRDKVYRHLHNRYCDPVMDIVLQLRGLYVKLGQVLSARPDFLPPQYIELFSTLQDNIPQWPLESVHTIVTRDLKKEFGLEWEDIFESMDEEALGSASIGQVHRAVLTSQALTSMRSTGYSGGPVVAVKVMHDGAEETFAHDFQVFRWLCRVALPEWHGFLSELERGMMTEFDYRREAVWLARVRENMANSPYWDHVRVPEPVQALCCKEILVMEMFNGPKLINAIEDELVAAFGDRKKADEFIARRKREALSGKVADNSHLLHEVGFVEKLRLGALIKKCRRYIKTLVAAHGHQIFLDGCFNGDPHFGNVLLLEKQRLGLIDFGVTRRLTREQRLSIAKVVAALGPIGDDTTVANSMRELGFAVEKKDDDATMVKYARLFFDSDQESADLGFATPQHYFSSLMEVNPLTNIPDEAVFVARISFLFRGMGSALGGGQVSCSSHWWQQAHKALVDAGLSPKKEERYFMALRPTIL